MCSAMSGHPWDSPMWPLNMLFPPDATPPRGLDPPTLSSSKLASSPKPFLFSDDPQTKARKEQLRAAWTARPRPARQDGMFPYLLIRAAPGDQGARPAVLGQSPDILVWAGFPPASPNTATFQNNVCDGAGVACTVAVRVWNLGPVPAIGVAVRLYSAWSPTSLQHPEAFTDYKLVGGTYINLAEKGRPECQQLVHLPMPWMARQSNPSPDLDGFLAALVAVASVVTDPVRNSPTVPISATDRHMASLILSMEGHHDPDPH